MRNLVTLTLGTLLATAALAQSPYRACMIESERRVMGAPSVASDCLQAAKGVRRAAIKERCEGIANYQAGGSGLGNRNATLLTWLPQCPKGADAVCKKAFEGEVDVYYYNRNSAQLAAMGDNCDREGGQWVDLD